MVQPIFLFVRIGMEWIGSRSEDVDVVVDVGRLGLVLPSLEKRKRKCEYGAEVQVFMREWVARYCFGGLYNALCFLKEDWVHCLCIGW